MAKRGQVTDSQGDALVVGRPDHVNGGAANPARLALKVLRTSITTPRCRLRRLASRLAVRSAR
jgi:hypothetical protein